MCKSNKIDDNDRDLRKLTEMLIRDHLQKTIKGYDGSSLVLNEKGEKNDNRN